MAELIDLRAALVRGIFKVIESPKCLEVLRTPKALGLLIDVMSVPARCRSTLRDSGRSMARVLGLATAEDLRQVELDLEQRLRRRIDGRYGSD